jgi:putative transposase
MEIATLFIEEGYPKKTVLMLCELARSSFYYKTTDGKPGRRPWASPILKNGKIICDSEIVTAIKTLFENPFVDYGYLKTYYYLKQQGYKISKNKVYKIMATNNLLRFQRAGREKLRNRKWVTQLVPTPVTEFSFLEFDIKFVWVAGKNKSVMVLTVLDVFSRWQMGHYIAFSIKKEDVIKLFDKLFLIYELPINFDVRCDNGSQFIAQKVREYFDSKGVSQEFTKPATPQQNAHIESYHSIMESAICKRFEFENLTDTRLIMNQFREFYNFERIHSGVGFQSPYKYLLEKGTDMKSAPFTSRI